MASRVARPNGHFWVQAFGPSGKRQTIRLGVCAPRQAEEVRQRIAILEAAARLGASLDPATEAWLATIGDELHERLVAGGFAPRRQRSSRATTLAELLDRFPSSLDVKDQTTTNHQAVIDNLRTFFGPTRLLAEITAGDASEFVRWLARDGRKKSAGDGPKKPMAPSTVSRRSRTAKQIFLYAVRKGWIPENPFEHIAGGVETNEENECYVSAELVRHLIAESPSFEFRVILALARFAGLRTPSEPRSLTWAAVDWEGWLKIPKGKTGRREPPLSSECLAALTTLWETAGQTSLIVPRHAGVSPAAWTDELERLCRRVGVPLWPRPWNNMRASCETDWLKGGFDIFTTSAWLGHSPEVALRHYNRVAKQRSSWRVAELPSRLRIDAASGSASPPSEGVRGEAQGEAP